MLTEFSYSVVADRVRRGEIALHFIGNKIQIEVEEALKACESKIKKKSNVLPMVRKDLFA
jgi:hypothetical protein